MKLVEYSLNPAHPRGGSKAWGFEQILGITASDAEHLEDGIRAAVLDTPISAVYARPPFGIHCEVRIPIRGIRSKRSRVCDVITAWELADELANPRMTTAYLKP